MASQEQVRLCFDPVESEIDPPATQMSAAVRIGDTLIAASDEGGALEILQPKQDEWHQVARIHLEALIRLPSDSDNEIDIEGLAVEEDWLWVVGCHALKRQKPRGKFRQQDLSDLKIIKRDADRFVLARLPLDRHKSGYMRPVDRDGNRRPSMVEISKRSSTLISWLSEDPMLAPFLDIPSKENGLDIEGIAVDREHVWLGLRGPVLRGFAVLLQLDLKANKRDVLKARKIDGTRRFRKYLLPLGGLGVRDLELDGKDLLILTGPTMSAPGPAQVVRWKGATSIRGSQAVGQKELDVVLDLVAGTNTDKPEAICHWSKGRLLVLHDNPSDTRVAQNSRSLIADLMPI